VAVAVVAVAVAVVAAGVLVPALAPALQLRLRERTIEVTMKTRRLISLLPDTRGSMTIPALLFFTVLTAAGGLIIDIQRVYGVHGQMQAYVDNVALAAAAELDGLNSGGGALNRALRAAVGVGGVGPLVTGTQNFATVPALNVQKLTFLSSLDTDPGALGKTPTKKETDDGWVLCTWEGGWNNNCNVVGANIRTANFVEVRAAPRTVNYLVLPIADAIGQFFGAGPIASNATVALRATAGYMVEVCNNIPLMFCNPNEAAGANTPFTPLAGQMFYAGIRTGPLFPGDFALIEAFAGNGADEIREAMARVNPNTFCYSRVSRKPGINAGPVSQGLNVRFDVYDGPLAQNNKNPDYTPGPNVLKGYVGNNACTVNFNNDASKDSIPYPRDNCFMATAPGGAGSGCVNVDGLPKMGDAKWARAEYWKQNHPEALSGPTGTINGFSYNDPLSPIGGWTRYQTYRYEIDTPAPVNNINVDEKSAPACYNNVANPPTTDPDLDRRVVTAAVVNCLGDAGRLNSQSGVPAKIYARLFLTEPVDSNAWNKGIERPTGVLKWKAPPSQEGIWAEMIGIVPPNEEVLHVYPVLYR